MTSREKILASLHGTPCYPVPADFFEGYVHPVLNEGLCRHYGISPEDQDALCERLNIGFSWGRPVYAGPKLATVELDMKPSFPAEQIVKGIWGTIEGIDTLSDLFPRPFGGDISVEQIEAHPWPDPDWFDYDTVSLWRSNSCHKIRSTDEWVQEYPDRVRIYSCWNPIFCRLMDLFGMQNGLECIIAERDLIEAATSHIEEYLIGYYTKATRAVRGKVDILRFGDDFAGQKSMLLSPQTWRELFLPTWQKLFAIAHENGLMTMMHLCGAVRPVLGDLIDAGLDIYQNVQTLAHGMEPKGLVRDFGKDLIFYGGIDVQSVLPFGSAEKVKEEVHRFIDLFGSNGKYILSSTHIMHDDIPYENVLAMYEAAATYHACQEISF